MDVPRRLRLDTDESTAFKILDRESLLGRESNLKMRIDSGSNIRSPTYLCNIWPLPDPRLTTLPPRRKPLRPDLLLHCCARGLVLSVALARPARRRLDESRPSGRRGRAVPSSSRVPPAPHFDFDFQDDEAHVRRGTGQVLLCGCVIVPRTAKRVRLSLRA